MAAPDRRLRCARLITRLGEMGALSLLTWSIIALHYTLDRVVPTSGSAIRRGFAPVRQGTRFRSPLTAVRVFGV